MIFQAIVIVMLVLILSAQVKLMSTSPVTRAQLDVIIGNVVIAVNTGFADLLAKIAAGQVTTPEDFTTEATALQGLITSAASVDPGPQATDTPVS